MSHVHGLRALYTSLIKNYQEIIRKYQICRSNLDIIRENYSGQFTLTMDRESAKSEDASPCFRAPVPVGTAIMHRKIYIKKVVFFLLSPLLVGCLGYPESVKPVTGFELQRYLGKWYEIARLYHSFERGMDNVTAEYFHRDDGGHENNTYDGRVVSLAVLMNRWN